MVCPFFFIWRSQELRLSYRGLRQQMTSILTLSVLLE